MTDEGITLLILTGLLSATLGGTATMAYVLKRYFGREWWIILPSGLAGPILLLIASLVFAATDTPEGPPPGAVLLGVLIALAILTPITMLVSWLVIWLPRRS